MDLFPIKSKHVNLGLAIFFQPGIDRFVTGSLILFISVIDLTDFNVLFIRRLRSWSYSYIPKVYDHDDFSANETS